MYRTEAGVKYEDTNKVTLDCGDNTVSGSYDLILDGAVDDIKSAIKSQNIIINEGDIIMFYTGWTDAKLDSDPKAWVSGEPGTDNAAMEYLMTFNPMAVGSDTWGIDNVPPSKGDKVFYGHVTALQNNGVYLLETMNTGKLVKEGIKEFMFVLGQARV